MGLLLSRELYDVRTGRLLFRDSLGVAGSETVVDQALRNEEEDVIRYMASDSFFDFKRSIRDAVIGVLTASGSSYIHYPLPVSALKLFAKIHAEDPSIGLRLDHVAAMGEASRRGDLDVMKYLCAQPETDLVDGGSSYFWEAVCNSNAPSTEAVRFLLGPDEVEIRDDMMDDVVAYAEDKAVIEVLRTHPKTQRYMEQYDLLVVRR